MLANTRTFRFALARIKGPSADVVGNTEIKTLNDRWRAGRGALAPLQSRTKLKGPTYIEVFGVIVPDCPRGLGSGEVPLWVARGCPRGGALTADVAGVPGLVKEWPGLGPRFANNDSS